MLDLHNARTVPDADWMLSYAFLKLIKLSLKVCIGFSKQTGVRKVSQELKICIGKNAQCTIDS